MLLNAAVLPPALIGDESTLAPSRTNTHQESRARTKRQGQNRTKRMARHRAIGNGSFPFAPRVQTARAGTDAGSAIRRRSASCKDAAFSCRRPWKLCPAAYPSSHGGSAGRSIPRRRCQFFSQHADQGGDRRNDHGPDKNPDEPKCLKPAGKLNSNSRGCSSTLLPITSGRMTLSAVSTTRAPHRIKKTPFQR